MVIVDDVEGQARRFNEKVILIVFLVIIVVFFAIVHNKDVVIVIVLVPQFKRFLYVFGVFYLLDYFVEVELLLLRPSIIF